MRVRATFTILALLAAALPLAAQDWAGKGRAQGVIEDEQGKPVEGAMITLRRVDSPDEGPEPIYTNEKGRWSLLGLGGGSWRVLIDAEGYTASEGTYRVNEYGAAPLVKIVLTRNPFSSIDRGDQLLDAGEYAAARAEYEKALSDLEEAPAARLRSRIGDTYLAEGELEAARAEYRKALPYIAAEEQAHTRLQLANTYQREGDTEKARAELESVLPLLGPEGQSQVLLTIARGYDMEDKRELAVSTLERALELTPDDTGMLQLTADLLTRLGREEEARAYLDRLPEGTKLPTDMVLNIGIRLYNEGDYTKAMDYFDRAIEENPTLAEGFYYRGLSYLAILSTDPSVKEMAKADFKRMLELEPDSPLKEDVESYLGYLDSN